MEFIVTILCLMRNCLHEWITFHFLQFQTIFVLLLMEMFGNQISQNINRFNLFRERWMCHHIGSGQVESFRIWKMANFLHFISQTWFRTFRSFGAKKNKNNLIRMRESVEIFTLIGYSWNSSSPCCFRFMGDKCAR